MFAGPELNDILLDLSESEYLDSANLRLLAKIANQMRKRFNRKVTPLSTNPNINFLLDNMGFDQVFTIVSTLNIPAKKMQPAPELPDSEKSRALVVLEAHRLLMELNNKNRDVFKDIVEQLEKETGKAWAAPAVILSAVENSTIDE